MAKISVSPQGVVDFLNQLVKLDSEAIEKLINTRVPCNKELADHPTVQVMTEYPTGYSVGLLGLLNGLFGVDDGGWGFIAAVYDENEKFLYFKII